MSKLLYLIRHGHALHNALFPTLGVQAFRIPEVIDAPLTEIGLKQASDLGDSWLDKKDIELVLVSPLMRCLQTATAIFDPETPMKCQEFLREYPIGEDTCNKRSDTETLKDKFPTVNFTDINLLNDSLWTEERESIEGLDQRIEEMITYIRGRPEHKIAIVSHSSYIGHFKDNHIAYQENGDEELKHCFPYEYELNI